MAAKSFEPVLSAKAWELLCSLPRRKQQRLIHWINHIAQRPSLISDYQATDDAGRTLENIRLEHFIITYWIDGPVWELRVLDVMVT